MPMSPRVAAQRLSVGGVVGTGDKQLDSYGPGRGFLAPDLLREQQAGNNVRS